MSQHLADDLGMDAEFEAPGGEGVADAVEGDGGDPRGGDDRVVVVLPMTLPNEPAVSGGEDQIGDFPLRRRESSRDLFFPLSGQG
ncbi:MAG: hypothetical protein QOJ59_2960, partial [Thermomicrobiales bacterium]|nr:hypothetical protein [Thermomicrobiales bacterium]